MCELHSELTDGFTKEKHVFVFFSQINNAMLTKIVQILPIL